MENIPSTSVQEFDLEKKIQILLAEYQAIEQMHIHYDLINMSMTAIITAGVFTIWGLVIQSAFQSHAPINIPIFGNSVSILALTLLFVLSVWIRYMTIHRCIVIKKLNRSHEIESFLNMKQNLIFLYSAEKLRINLDSDIAKRRPGGHTLELLLYFSLATLGGIIALIFQLHIKANWNVKNYLFMGLLLISPLLTILWMSFCKLDVGTTIKGDVELGFPWNILLIIIKPINSFIRWFININPSKL